MQLRPFEPHDHIEDVYVYVKRHYSEPDAIDDQTIFNDNMPEPEQSPLTKKTFEIDANEPELLIPNMISFIYEHERFHEVPPLPSSLMETLHNNQTYRFHPENQSDQTTHSTPNNESEQNLPAVNDVSSTTSSVRAPTPITRNNITRNSLGEALMAKTFDNFLVHQLQAKLGHLKLVQPKAVDQTEFTSNHLN